MKENDKTNCVKKSDELDYSKLNNVRHPFVCPVCGGNGLVANGFYDQIGGAWNIVSTAPETCRSCNGTGIVWGS
jgi:DnaJ-class molecular chaperone